MSSLYPTNCCLTSGSPTTYQDHKPSWAFDTFPNCSSESESDLDRLALLTLLPPVRILEKAETLYHAGRFRLDWDQVGSTLALLDEINVENEQAMVDCEEPFRLDPGELLASYV